MKKIQKYFSKEYIDDILIRLSHHSTAIEGNTITLPETISIILYNKVHGDFNVREIYEIKNHEEAFNYILENIYNGNNLDLNIIKNIHKILMDKLSHDKGKFKEYENMIVGATFMPVKPSEVLSSIQQLIDNTNYQLEYADGNDKKIEIILDNHIQFERIHPFSDGNGRTGRLLLNYYLLSNDLPPLIINKEEKSKYIEFLNNQDLNEFKIYALSKLKEEKSRMQKFLNKESQQIPNIQMER